MARNRRGVEVPAEASPRVSTLAAIELDPELDDEARSHFRNQYVLLADLTRMRRRQAQMTDEQAIEEAERLSPGVTERVLHGDDGESGTTPSQARHDAGVTRTGDEGGSVSRRA